MTDTTDATETRGRTRIERYDPTAIEPRWQARWDELGLHETDLHDESKPKYYLLTMYPYPSGDLHIGHWYIVTPTDALARYRRMHGYNVFFPIGFDAFGLPAENAAIKSGGHPFTWTMQNIENMRRQLRTMGATFAWSAEVVTADPTYYRWNQWLFLRFLEAGPRLSRDVARSTGARTTGRWPASRSRGPIAIAGAAARSSRSATSTSGSSRPPSTPTSCSTSRASSGPSRSVSSRRTGSAAPRAPRSTSRRRPMPHQPGGDALRVFTTRPDTLFGATFMVLAPEHPLVDRADAPGSPRGGRRLRRPGAAPDRDRPPVDRPREDRRRARRRRDQPGQRRADPDLHRRLRAVRLRHRRDHGRARARRARLRVRGEVRPADPAGRRRPRHRRRRSDGPRVHRPRRRRAPRQQRRLRRPAGRRGRQGDRRQAGRDAAGPSRRSPTGCATG